MNNQALAFKPLNAISKGDLAEQLYSGITYDCAIPISFIKLLKDRGFNDDLSSQLIMLYPDNEAAYIAPLTTSAIQALATIASYAGGSNNE